MKELTLCVRARFAFPTHRKYETTEERMYNYSAGTVEEVVDDFTWMMQTFVW